MPIQTEITLETLRCIAESDRRRTSHSEPYVWPFLASFTANSFETSPTEPSIADSRKIIMNEMRAGQSAALAGPANRLTATFVDDRPNRHLILVVALLEADDTPAAAMRAGYQAYLDELRLRIGHNILALSNADEEEKAQIFDDIRKRVRTRVFAAIEANLPTLHKISIGLGNASSDDFIAADFVHFSEPRTTSFTLKFAGVSGDPLLVGAFPFKFEDLPVSYELDGRLVVVDSCQTRVDAVDAAGASVLSLRKQLQSLQKQLQTAGPLQKRRIIAAIETLESERIPAAEQVLGSARQALRRCRQLAPLERSNLEPAIG